jgi:hypothetical protein
MRSSILRRKVVILLLYIQFLVRIKIKYSLRKSEGNVPSSSPYPLLADSFFWGFFFTLQIWRHVGECLQRVSKTFYIVKSAHLFYHLNMNMMLLYLVFFIQYRTDLIATASFPCLGGKQALMFLQCRKHFHSVSWHRWGHFSPLYSIFSKD